MSTDQRRFWIPQLSHASVHSVHRTRSLLASWFVLWIQGSRGAATHDLRAMRGGAAADINCAPVPSLFCPSRVSSFSTTAQSRTPDPPDPPQSSPSHPPRRVIRLAPVPLLGHRLVIFQVPEPTRTKRHQRKHEVAGLRRGPALGAGHVRVGPATGVPRPLPPHACQPRAELLPGVHRRIVRSDARRRDRAGLQLRGHADAHM